MMNRIITIFMLTCLATTTTAQSLYNKLNDMLLIAEKINVAIERGQFQESVVLYESEEDDEEYWFSGHTTVSLWQTKDGWIRITTLHEFGGSGYEVKSLYLNEQLVPLVLIDELKHDFRKCVVFEDDEPAIYAESRWDEDDLKFGDYRIYRITPKEYRYAAQILSQYEHVLEDWVKSVQRKANKRRVGEYAVMNQMAVQSQPTQTPIPATPEQQLKQAARALLIQSLDQALQKWLK